MTKKIVDWDLKNKNKKKRKECISQSYLSCFSIKTYAVDKVEDCINERVHLST